MLLEVSLSKINAFVTLTKFLPITLMNVFFYNVSDSVSDSKLLCHYIKQRYEQCSTGKLN